MKVAAVFKKSLLLLLVFSLASGTLISCRPATGYKVKETQAPPETSSPEDESETIVPRDESESPNETDNPQLETEKHLSETTDQSEETDARESETTTQETSAPETIAPIPVSNISLPFSSLILGTGTSLSPRVSIYPEDANNKYFHIISTNPSVAYVDDTGSIIALEEGDCTISFVSAYNNNIVADITVQVKQSPCPVYIDGILIANKTYSLPSDYALGVDSEAYNSLLTMLNDAAGNGIGLWIVSGYRSYWDQYTIYNNYVARDGQAEADRYSARPGHSEHQSGLAFDLNSLYQSFGETAEGLWLAENCHKYGFIIRYPQDKEHITGYMYEPWHVRYVGKDLAGKVKASGLCLEEYFGITSAYDN